MVTTYFERNFEGGEIKPFPEPSKWKQARKEVTVRGDTEVVIQLEPKPAN